MMDKELAKYVVALITILETRLAQTIDNENDDSIFVDLQFLKTDLNNLIYAPKDEEKK